MANEDDWVERFRAEREAFVEVVDRAQGVPRSQTPVSSDHDLVEQLRAEREAYYAAIVEVTEVTSEVESTVESTVESEIVPAIEEASPVAESPLVAEAPPAEPVQPVEILVPEAPAVSTATRILIEPPVVLEGTNELVPPPERSEAQVDEIVDRLFDKLQHTWKEPLDRLTTDGAELATRIEEIVKLSPAMTTGTEAVREDVDLKETTYELVEALKAEIPRAMRSELVAPLRKEILAGVRKEIMRAVREEVVEGMKPLVRIIDRLATIETRIARLEGSLDREIMVNFPKGAMQVNVPITVPEREIKIAAPINVQPSHVYIDKGAVQVEFTRQPKGKRQVNFDRDPHDNTVQSAEIIDVPPE